MDPPCFPSGPCHGAGGVLTGASTGPQAGSIDTDALPVSGLGADDTPPWFSLATHGLTFVGLKSVRTLGCGAGPVAFNSICSGLHGWLAVGIGGSLIESHLWPVGPFYALSHAQHVTERINNRLLSVLWNRHTLQRSHTHVRLRRWCLVRIKGAVVAIPR